ncbi:MAG: hypothetical protein ACRDPJ_19790 [Nocardioidaceae bacterium]
MDISTQFEALQTRAAEANATVKSGATEKRDQLKQRIHQAHVDLEAASKDAKDEAGEAADQGQSKWAQMKADASAKSDEVKAKIGQRTAQLDAKVATADADSSEAEAYDAIRYASWAVELAQVAALDAIDARLYANDRVAAAGQV